MYKLCFYSEKECQKYIFLQYGDLNFEKKIPSLSTLGIPNGDIKLSKLWEKLNLWGKATVDKSDWIKAWHKKRLLLVTITLITLRKTYSITLCQVVKLTWMFLEVQQ